jgi:hypothetical protein
MREQISMTDEVSQVLARAQSLAAGGKFEPVRDAASVDDEARVVRAAIDRIERQMTDARSVAVLTISKQCRLPERAAELRAAIAAGIDAVLAAMAASDQFAAELERAEVSPTGPRWPGCGEPAIIELLAGLRIDLGVTDAETLLMLERRAGIRVEPAFVMRDRPATVVKSVRKKIADKLDEIGEMISG